MSENEKFDDQLRNGTDYVNLPAHRFSTDQAPTWTRELEDRRQIISQPLFSGEPISEP